MVGWQVLVEIRSNSWLQFFTQVSLPEMTYMKPCVWEHFCCHGSYLLPLLGSVSGLCWLPFLTRGGCSGLHLSGLTACWVCVSLSHSIRVCKMEWLGICLGALFLMGTGADDAGLLYPDIMEDVRSPRSVSGLGDSGSGSGNSGLEPMDPFLTGSGSLRPHNTSITSPGNGELVKDCEA